MLSTRCLYRPGATRRLLVASLPRQTLVFASQLSIPLSAPQHQNTLNTNSKAPLSLQRLTPVDRQRYPPAPQHCCFYLMPLSSSSRAHPSCRHQSRRGRTSRARGRGRTTVWTQHAIHTEQRACSVSEKKARQLIAACCMHYCLLSRSPAGTSSACPPGWPRTAPPSPTSGNPSPCPRRRQCTRRRSQRTRPSSSPGS